MNSKTTLFFWILTSTLLVSNLLKSQPNSTEEEDVVRNIKFFAWDQAIRDLKLWQSEGAEEVVIPNGAPTRTMRYAGPPVASFGKMETDEDDNEVFVPRHQVRLPETDDPITLIFFPHNDSYRIVPFSESLVDFPEGSFRLVNLTSTRFLVRVGGTDVRVPRGGFSVVTPDTDEKRSITVLMAREKDGQWERAYSARWGLMPEHRVTVFLTREPATGRFSLRRYVE